MKELPQKYLKIIVEMRCGMVFYSIFIIFGVEYGLKKKKAETLTILSFMALGTFP